MHNHGTDEAFIICWNFAETYGALPKYLIVGRKVGHTVGPIINWIVCHMVGSIIYGIVYCMGELYAKFQQGTTDSAKVPT